jgi:alpha-glucosidase
LPWPPEPDVRNVEAERADPTSVLHLYRRTLSARRASPALHLGTWRPLESSEGVLAYERRLDDDRRIVIVNFSREEKAVSVPGDWTVEVASDGRGEGAPYRGSVARDQALVLRST